MNANANSNAKRYNNAAANRVGSSGPRGVMNLRDVLGITLGKHRLQGGISKARGIVAWPQVVGAELARLTHARTQQGSCLVVEVRDSSMAHFLTMQRATFLQRLQAQLGDQSVTELRFVVGKVSQVVPAPPPTPLPPPDQARAEKMARSLPPAARSEIQQAALQAAQAVTRARRWREQQGYAPCPVCQEPSPTQPCRACALTLQEGLVVRASRRLQREPKLLGTLPAELGDTGTQAARYLALQRMGEQLEMLTQECLEQVGGAGGDIHYRAFLRQQAAYYLQLYWQRTELGPADWLALPERIRQAAQQQ